MTHNTIANDTIDDTTTSPPVTANAPTAPTTPTQHSRSSFAIISFVLGIASFVSSWTFIAPLVGLIFGAVALRRGTSERTLALWGVWLNAIMLTLTVLAVVLFIVLGGITLFAAIAAGAA